MPHVFFAENFGEFQQQRTAAASRIVDLIDFGFAHDGELCQQLGNLLRGKVFPAAFARVPRIHAHQKLIRVAERVYRIVLIPTQLHIADAVEKLDQFLVSSFHRRTEFIGIYVNVVEQALEIFFAVGTLRRTFDGFEDLFQRFVQIGIDFRFFAHVYE